MRQKWDKLIRSIDVPFNPLDENSNRDNIASSLINLIILIGLLGLIPLEILRGIKSEIFLAAIVFVAITVFARIGVQRGKSQIISLFFLGFAWVSFTATILFLENGLRAPVYIATQLFLVVYAGLMHGRTAVIVTSVLSLAVSGIVAFMESQGIFLMEPRIPDVRFSLIALFIFIPTIGFLLTRTLENLQLSISLYRNESRIRYESEQNVKQLNQELELAYQTTLEGWSRALELKDKETEGHSHRVTDLTIEVAEKFDFDENAIRYVYYGALLHDIGKMGVPDEILNKPGELYPRRKSNN
ncbi:MAG: HD-GYP domain-containing protein [Anaerolineales bacterium]